ncbi:hypothetical protein [Streptomyces sp. NPDC001020]
MRAIRAASVALLGLTALACTAPASAAQGGGVGGITPSGTGLRPTAIDTGGRAAPSARGCHDNAGTSSGTFETVAVSKGQDSARAVVSSVARPGNRYEVSFRCGGERNHTDLMIADSNGNDRGDNGFGGQGNGNGRGNTLFGGQGNGNGRGDSLFGGRGNGNGRGDNQYGGGGGGNGRGGNDSRDRPDYEQHGVRAGAGGSIGGFDLKKIGLGAALIAAPLGAAWRMSRRRTADDKS